MFFRKQVRRLVDFYFRSAYWRGLPEPEPEGQVAFVEWYLSAGAPEFRYLYELCIVSLHLLCLLLKGKTFNSLSDSQKEEVMDRLLSSRNPLLRNVPVLLSLPILISYYRREEVRTLLGFDPQGLKADAEQRVVTRHGNQSPQTVAATKAPGDQP